MAICPFCGDNETEGEEDASEPEKPAKEEKPAKPSKDKPKEAPKEPAKVVKPAKEDKVKAKEAPKPATKPEPKAEKPSKLVLDPPLNTNAPTVSRVIAKAEDGTEVIDKSGAMVDSLDDSVRKISELKNKSAKGIWDIGVEIQRIFDQKLWRLRVTDKGHATYKTFAQFCKSELEMGYSHANRLMQVASTFPKEMMERIGISKCSIMLHLPAEARAKLLESAESKSKSALSKEARELKEGDAPKMPRTALTIAMAPGIVEIPMMARPKDGVRKISNVAAFSIDDDPACVEKLPNNVQVRYMVIRDFEGRFVLRIDRRRIQAGKLFEDEPENADEEEEKDELGVDVLDEVGEDEEVIEDDEDEDEDEDGK